MYITSLLFNSALTIFLEVGRTNTIQLLCSLIMHSFMTPQTPNSRNQKHLLFIVHTPFDHLPTSSSSDASSTKIPHPSTTSIILSTGNSIRLLVAIIPPISRCVHDSSDVLTLSTGSVRSDGVRVWRGRRTDDKSHALGCGGRRAVG